MNATESTAIDFAPTSSRAIVTPKGKECGTRYTFTGNQTAGELRKALKATGLKGKELDNRINAVLTGNATLAEQLAHAFITSESKRGVVWDVAESRTKSAVLKGVLPKAPKVEVPAPAKIDVDAMSADEAAELFAKLAAKLENA